MSRGKALLLLLILMCPLLYQVPTPSAEDFTPLLKVTARDVYVTAGEANQIEIELKNTGSFNVYEVETFLSVPASTPGISVIDQAHKVFNKIGDGETKVYHPTIYVDGDTPLGDTSWVCCSLPRPPSSWASSLTGSRSRC